MTELLEDARALAPDAGPAPEPAEETEQRRVEKLLLGSVAAFMTVWILLIGWLAWWILA